MWKIFEQAPVTQYVVLSVDSPRDLPARIVDTDADVTMSLGKKSAIESLQMMNGFSYLE